MTRKEMLKLSWLAGDGLQTPTPAVLAGQALFKRGSGDVAKAIAETRLILSYLEAVEEDDQRIAFEETCQRVDAVNESATRVLQPPHLRLVK